MLDKCARWWKVAAGVLLCLSPIFAGAAEITLDAATLARYVGNYKLGDTGIQAIMTVTVNGTQLATQLTGQGPVEVYATTQTHFVVHVVEADLDFVTSGSGPATALILHQNGRDITMPRIDDAVAAKFNADLAKRAASKTPQPGAEAEVRDFFARIAKGMPANYAKMSPELAAAAAQQADMASSMISSLGALQSLTFQGAPGGVDTFLAKFEKGSLLVSIHLDSKGIIDGMGMRPGP